MRWVHARGELDLKRPHVMGVINLTPDSFYDGGKLLAPGSDHANVSVVLRRGTQMRQGGADIIDVGGESTRPRSEPVSSEREAARVVPAVERLCGATTDVGLPISIDTRHAEVARAAMAAGAAIINDVSGLADPDMAKVAAETGAGLVIGHLRGDPATMQDHVEFHDLLREVGDELAQAFERAVAAGVSAEHIVVDPCVGFGKTAEQSAALVASAAWLRERTGRPVLIGASRKGFLGVLTGRDASGRLIGSIAAALVAVHNGAAIVRAHDVAETVEALCVADGIARALTAAKAG